MGGPWASARQQMKLIWLICSHFIYNFIFPASLAKKKNSRDFAHTGPMFPLGEHVRSREAAGSFGHSVNANSPQPSGHRPPSSLLSMPGLLA